MKILHPNQLKELDAYTLKNEPIHSINLMERAAGVCTDWIMKNIEIHGEVKVFVGPGNNGGDGLAIARMLAEEGLPVAVFTIGKLSDDALVNYNRLIEQNKTKVFTITGEENFPLIYENELIIDALFGYGLNRRLEGFPAQLVTYINKCAAETVVAIDIPSGLMAEDNSMQIRRAKDAPGNYRYENVIQADYTLTLELPFLSFFFANIDPHVGEWHFLPIGLHEECLKTLETKNYYLTKEYVAPKIKKRKKFSHKGSYGHALLVAGNYGKMGAAVLAARACKRSGVGLITSHIPKIGFQVLQSAIPESMVSIDESELYFTKIPDLTPFNAIGVGPGIGMDKSTEKALHELIQSANVPMVLDADAINILGKNMAWMSDVPEQSIFTPHPKELERLLGVAKDYYHRNELQKEFAQKHNVYIILKGAHTSITCPDGTSFYNSTGNPGMATGGSGDVLTGMILALLAQSYHPKDAAILGVYLHGLAGDIAAAKIGQEALTSGDIIENIGLAFMQTKKK